MLLVSLTFKSERGVGKPTSSRLSSESHRPPSLPLSLPLHSPSPPSPVPGKDDCPLPPKAMDYKEAASLSISTGLSLEDNQRIGKECGAVLSSLITSSLLTWRNLRASHFDWLVFVSLLE